MVDWMKRLPTGQSETATDSETRFLKTDVTHPKIIPSYPTILPLKKLPGIQNRIKDGPKPQIWKFNENSP